MRLIICKPFFFLRIWYTKRWLWSQAFLAETLETGNKNRCVTEATHVLRRKLRFRTFLERVCPRILSFESVDYFGTSEHLGGRKKRRILISKIVVNFLCMLLSLGMNMRFIFGDDLNDTACSHHVFLSVAMM